MSTLSEKYFEQLCEEKQIRYERISTTETRQADYKIWLGDVMVIAEVKQLDLNKDNKAVISAIQNGTEIASWFRTTGHIRVRKALDSAYPQLKNVAKEDHPALLIVYDNTHGLSHLGHDDVLNAMYGDETVLIAWSEQEPIKSNIIDHRFGGNKRVTWDQNRAISGIGLLIFNENQKKCTFDLFHNIHARKKIENKLAWYIADRQFTISNPEQYQDWISIAK